MAAFFVVSNERDARYFDIYRYDSASYERTLVYKNEHGHFRTTSRATASGWR